MPIGRFSNACRLSVKSLRHYDEIDLLKPAYVDPDSGYRYYSRDQGRDAVMIAMLRSLDLPLETIRSLLQADGDSVRDVLELERARIASELAKQQQILNSIERIAREGDLVPYEIGVRLEPAYRLASLCTTTSAEHMVTNASELMYRLFDELDRAGGTHSAPYMCINEAPDAKGEILVHACVSVDSQSDVGSAVELIDVAGGPVAWLTHVGSYDELGIAYHALSAWTQERGHTQRDALREIYYNDPASTPVDELKTEVLVPINA